MATLKDRVAIVTGAGGGLGKTISEEFLKAGAKVVVVDINDERLKTTEEDLSKLGEVLTVNCNVTSEEAVAKLFADAKAKFGTVDILVNNAGLMDVFDPVGTLEKDRWDRVLAVNLSAPYMLSKAAVNEFLTREPSSGVILNVASQGGLRGFRAGAAYTASKHGLVGLTKNTAAFYASKGIRCNAICPGGMATNIADPFAAGGMSNEGYQLAAKYLNMDLIVPKERMHEMGNLAVYLCSNSSTLVNGSIVIADSGDLAAA